MQEINKLKHTSTCFSITARCNMVLPPLWSLDLKKSPLSVIDSTNNFRTFNHSFQNRTRLGGRTMKTENQDDNRFFKHKEPDFLLIL